MFYLLISISNRNLDQTKKKVEFTLHQVQR